MSARTGRAGDPAQWEVTLLIMSEVLDSMLNTPLPKIRIIKMSNLGSTSSVVCCQTEYSTHTLVLNIHEPCIQRFQWVK